MELGPKQRPNPPFWYGVSTPESLLAAARHGMNMVTLGPTTMVKELGNRYRTEVARHKGGAGDLNPQIASPMVGAIRHIYVAGDEREVEQIAAPAYRTYYNNITKLWLDFRTIPAVGFTPDLARACQMEVAHAGTVERIRRMAADAEQTKRFARGHASCRSNRPMPRRRWISASSSAS